MTDTQQAGGDGRAVGDLGERLRNSREAIGMSITKLADQIGVSRNTITSYEQGRTEPNASDLLKLASALGCSLGDLLNLPDATARPRFAFRAHKPLHRNPDVAVMAQKYLRAYDEIEEIVGARLPVRLRRGQLDLDEAGLGEDANVARRIVAVAQGTREDSGFGEIGPTNIVVALERLGVRCVFFDHDADGLDGLSVEQGEMSLVLLRDRDRSIERVIFSAAHELGHLVLHPHLFVEHPSAEDDDRNYEREANIFAASFLVPEGDLLQVWNDERLARLPVELALVVLKQRFQVSASCLFERLRQLGMTTVGYPAYTSRMKRLLGITKKATREELEPNPLPPEALYRSTRFERLIQAAFGQGDIGLAKVAEMLQLTVDDARSKTRKWVKPSA